MVKKAEKDCKFLSDLKRLTIDYNDMAFNSITDAFAQFENSDNEILFKELQIFLKIKLY